MQKITGKVVDIVKKEVFNGAITIENGKIKSIEHQDDVEDQFIIPGFIDAHVHVESSMLIPSEFARLASRHGTVATISDPHEIGNVLGREGVEFMIENGLKTPFKFYFGAPSCVPATTFETAGATIDLDDIEALFNLPNVNYLAEMMNFPGVLNKDPEVMAKIALSKKMGKMVDGHAPGLRGEAAKNYIEAGISTDHECFTIEEALEKLNYGMKISIREGSAAKNFEALWPLIDSHPDEVMLCSDDKHPNDLAVGHINQLAARAVKNGCNVFNVLRACSLNTVKHYKMDVGLLQEGDKADFCVVNDLEDFNVKSTFINGEKVAENGETFIKSVEETPINNFHCNIINKEQIQVTDKSMPVRVIEVEDGQLITTETKAKLPSFEGLLQSDPTQDVLKLVVVNRYHDAKPAVSFIKNVGLKNGALASCVAHDSHNIIAVGVTDEEITRAINLIIAEKGGVSLVNGSEEMIVPLPVAGIMSHQDGDKVAQLYEDIDRKSKSMGVTLASPFMTLSFCALLVIPKLKLSDKGLFDGEQFGFVSEYTS
jgi:adenine deaminase